MALKTVHLDDLEITLFIQMFVINNTADWLDASQLVMGQMWHHDVVKNRNVTNFGRL